MKEITHVLFNTAVIYYLVLYLFHYTDILILIFITFCAAILNAAIDRLGHENDGLAIRRSKLIHSIEALIIMPLLFIGYSFYINTATLIVLVTLLNLPLHALLDLLNKDGLYSLIFEKQIRIADFRFNDILINSLLITISVIILYLAFIS
ncbi:MAG: hypothetical protein ARM1_0108 [Candidatus Micrarchaeota archaeon]|nr:MAG: hypothetical protein ARM1_0108 [Candidatus Micrarchaeota archaeon]